MMRIAIGADHAGYRFKEVLKRRLRESGYGVEDFGCDSEEAVDYPDYVRPAAESVASGRNELGIVLGGSGNGEAMAANKVRGIRCGVCWNEKSAQLAREHNNANVISIGARMVSREEGIRIVEAWLAAEYEGGRHDKRIAMLEGTKGEKGRKGTKAQRHKGTKGGGSRFAPEERGGAPAAPIRN